MCKLIINGGKRLCGEVPVQGSKNAALPILAAALLADEECVIHNCPNITDVEAAIEILRQLGAEAELNANTARVCAANICSDKIPKSLMERMRSSVMFLGAILARCGSASVYNPGGCNLGDRPIDIHLSSLKKLGVKITPSGEGLVCCVGAPESDEVTLLYPSVGATENIMLLCAGGGRSVRIRNAAREPEIVDLQNFLNCMGADICGAGTEVIRIGTSGNMHGCEYTIMPDRIAAATYACGAAISGGRVRLLGAEAEHMGLMLAALEAAGCEILKEDGAVTVTMEGRPRPIEMIKTLPYPGFPTDMQPMLGAVLSVAEGDSEIRETIFSRRFGYTHGLAALGADMRADGCSLKIRGRSSLTGADVTAPDLRGGAALVIGALAAQGITRIDGVCHIDRGYERIEDNFAALGADIMRIYT